MFFKKPPRLKKDPKRLLLVRPDAIGDMVLMIPVMKAIRKRFPDCHITVLASSYNARVINHLDIYDEIIHKKRLKTLREYWDYTRFLKSKNFDVALHFGIRDYIVWPCFFSIPINIGDKAMLGLWPIFRKHGAFYRNHDRSKHVVDYHFILGQALGLTLDYDEDLSIDPPEGKVEWAKRYLKSLGCHLEKPLVGIQVGVGYGNRPVRPDKYARYISALKKHVDVDVCIAGYSDQELEACQSIVEQTSESVFVLKKVPLEEFMGVISLFNVFVSVDTGPFHLGAAIGTPQLAIFPSKKVKPLSWGPFRNKHFIARNTQNCFHDCPHQNCPYDICSDDISEDDMVRKTKALLSGDGVETKLDQQSHWYSVCLPVLVLYDDTVVEDSKKLEADLRSWGFNVFRKELSDPHLFQFMRERDISIVHNLTNRRKWSLFILGQKLIKTLYHSPLFLHGKMHIETKDDLIHLYNRRFSKKLL